MAKHVLEPKLSRYLIDKNVATRKGYGTSKAIELIKKYLEYNKRYKEFYVLRLDISKYFYNIDHDILKSMLKDKLDYTQYNIISKIIDSTNINYINEYINVYKKKTKKDIYKNNKGLSIGAMSSQFLSIYYLYPLDYYIVHNLHLPCYCRYMDDFCIIHHDKIYLKKCLLIIENMLNDKYKLKVNKKKTRIINVKDSFEFLGLNFKVINNKTIIKLISSSKRRNTRRKKEINKLYRNGNISFKTYFNSKNSKEK